jgi:hypothetical protein
MTSIRLGNAVVLAYQRSKMLERRRPEMQDWTNFLGRESPEKVVPIRRTK